MARVETVQFIDDLDGSVIAENEAQTVEFSIDGKDFEIDLSAANAEKLRDALAEFVGAARKAQPKRKARGTGAKTSTEAQEAREWLLKNGHKVSDRGRIPVDLMDIWRQNKDLPEVNEAQADEPEVDEAPEQEPELDTSDTAVLAWHQVKGFKVPDTGKVNGLMKHRYLKAHGAA